MKSYFISFEFWNSDYHKYASGLIYANLGDELLIDIAKRMIKSDDPELNLDGIEIKIIAFNPI